MVRTCLPNLRQDRGLVAGAGADLEHPVILSKLQLLGHVGDHERLADGLPAGNPESAVAVGVGAIGRFHEDFARHLFHGAQHRLLADPPPPQGELEFHLFGRFRTCGHVVLVKGARSPRLAGGAPNG